MAPHGIFPAQGDDAWVAIACRDDADWGALAGVVAADWTRDARFQHRAGRLEHQDELERMLSEWTRARSARETHAALVRAGVPATPVQRPGERIDEDPSTAAWGLWPTVKHTAIGEVRVDGLPVHFSETDWEIARGGPCLGEHNERVFGELLGLAPSEIAELRRAGVI
jgi:crotonobetainyl-CoA:carnitine CoA-transferase CaiB-like acyl-CoA transferase